MTARWLCVGAIVVAASDLNAQTVLRVRVADSLGVSIPFAVLDASVGGRRVADSAGVAIFDMPRGFDATWISVRRVGFRPTSVLMQASDSQQTIVLASVARNLSAVVVSERRNTLLVDRGFYDRMEQVRRGAHTGEFITPEDLDRISPATVSRALSESRYVRIARSGSRQIAVLLGRGGCGYTILIDGQRMRGTLEEAATGNTSIDARGTSRGGASTGIEDLISGLEIAAIEVYPSAASAPDYIQARAMGGRGSCGIIAIWTGSRGT